MKLAGKLLAISIEITGLAIAIAAIPSGSTVQAQQVTQALSPEQINLRAKQITVRIDGSGIGSGVIIDQLDNTYLVLTNWHVVKNAGPYSIQTIDGRQHPVKNEDIQQISNLDLAIVKFSTSQNYQVATLGNSAQMIEGQNIYFTGYPGELSQEDNRYYRFFPANVVGILPSSANNGYALVYNGEAFPGMSGGPVLDKNALLVGIHGEANIHALTGATSNYAIPINTYQQAIANNNVDNSSARDTEKSDNQENASTEENQSNPPEVTITTNNSNRVLSSPQTETNPEDQPVKKPNANAPQSANATNGESVPKTAEGEQAHVPVSVTENTDSSTTTALVPEVNTSPNSPASAAIAPENTALISTRTGVNYTSLQKLLSEQQWSEADRQTNHLIKEIIATAKKNKPYTFIELKSITDFACQDLNTINRLWQEYSRGMFGFSPQQQIWLNVNKEREFSTETWRNFATLVGWKQGDIASSSGYLLYEQLTFEPQKAPMGHLPWWFAASEEQQNILKNAFNRCNFDVLEQQELEENQD